MTDRITFTAPLTADQGRRIISGRAVPYGVVANTSAGPTRFELGAISWDADRLPRLVREHDRTAVLGTAQLLADQDDGLHGTWRIANTTAGTDALVEAAEGLRDGLSVGVTVELGELDDDGTFVVTAGTLDHVGLVVDPAFGEHSRVDHVAASTPDPDPDPTPDPAPTTPPQESTTMATEPTPETTDELEAAAPEPTVMTAAHVRVGADRQVESLTAGALLQHMVLAQARGDEDSRRLVTAALAEDNVAGVPGMVPEARTRDLIAIIDGRRPYFDALEQRELPDRGMKITTPKLATKPTVDVIGEGVDVGTGGGSTAVSVTDDETTVESIKGANQLTVEVIERSDPSYIDELLRLFAEQYAIRQNTYVRAALVAAASASASASGASYNQMFATAKADSMGARRFPPNRIGIALNLFEALDGEEDTAGRPLWSGIEQRNAPGDIGLGTERGRIKGVPSFVDVDSSDDLALVFPSDAAYVYATPVAQVRAMQVSTMHWELGVYGFIAVQDRYPTAIRSATLTA